MDLLQQFKANWQLQFKLLSPTNCHLVLAVSGGLDSVVLLDLVVKSGFDCTIAHCNFNLRGEESERDETFIKALGEKYSKEVLVKQFETTSYADTHKISIQEAARKLRYDWFEEILQTISSKWKTETASNSQSSTINYQLLTAHHANDNIETVLFNFFRGTGISGLHGILPKQGNILRPLLFAKRDNILSYAEDNKLSWVEDSSNALDKYSRNYIRHQVIPLMQTIFPSVEDNLLHNIERLREVEQVYTQSIERTKATLIEQKGNEVHMPVLKLKKQTPITTIVYELIKDFSFSPAQVQDVLQLIDASTGKFVASATHRIIKNRNWLIIAPLQSKAANHILIEEKDRLIEFEKGKLELAFTSHTEPSTTNQKATLDATMVQFPLILRKVKTGDYFYPLGMSKKKKLSRFFIDIKLSKTEKENIWVLEDASKKIVWVVGYRIDNRFKILPTTQKVLQLTFES